MLQEPLLLIVGFFVIFLVIIVLTKIDLTISPESIADKDTLLSECIREFHSINETCNNIHEDLVSALEQLRSSRWPLFPVLA